MWTFLNSNPSIQEKNCGTRENLENFRKVIFQGVSKTHFGPCRSYRVWTHIISYKKCTASYSAVWISSEHFQFGLIWYVRMLTDFGGEWRTEYWIVEMYFEPCVENFHYSHFSLNVKFNVDLMKKGFNFWFSSHSKSQKSRALVKEETEENSKGWKISLAPTELQEIRKWNSTFHSSDR